jgi:hypothetical protein
MRLAVASVVMVVAVVRLSSDPSNGFSAEK